MMKTSDKWAWDKESIRRYRKTQEPYDWFQEFMMEQFKENPFTLDIWKRKTRTIKKDILPSGLIILTKHKQVEGEWETVVLTDDGKVLDFDYFPKKERPRRHEYIEEDFEKVKPLLKRMKWR